MADYDVKNLNHESLVVVVTSTFGNGEGPANGEVSSFFSFIIRTCVILYFPLTDYLGFCQGTGDHEENRCSWRESFEKCQVCLDLKQNKTDALPFNLRYICSNVIVFS